MTTAGPRVVVLGAGMAGLAAAWELTGGSVPGGGPGGEVVVVEAADRVGGKVRAAEVAGRAVDLAADGFLAARPEAVTLCTELGLAGDLVRPGTSGAGVWARGRLRMLPSDLSLGVPTRFRSLARSGILGPVELAGVARDVVVPHGRTKGVAGDRSVGAIVGARLGRAVVERLADPLIGGIHAGEADRLSAAAVFPQLLAADAQPGSLMHRLGTARRAALARLATDGPPPAPFVSLPGGAGSLPPTLAAALVGRGASVRTGTRAVHLERLRGRWRVTLEHPGRPGEDTLEADGVVVAVPAPAAARLLEGVVPGPAADLAGLAHAAVTVVTLVLPPTAVRRPPRGTGFLVPRTATVRGIRPLMTAATFLSRKWPHLARPGDELVRVSMGRVDDPRPRDRDDDALVAAAVDELAAVGAPSADPLEARVTRWDDAFPQYEVGHLLRVSRLEAELVALPGLAVAGSSLRGVGIPACVGSGRAAAAKVLGDLVGAAASVGRPPR